MAEENNIPPDSEMSEPPDSVAYNGPERRRTDMMHAENRMRMDSQERRITVLETLMAQNTEATLEGNKNVELLLEIVGGAQKGIRIGISATKTLSVAAKILTPIIIAAGVIWGWMHGKLPGGG